MVHDLDELVARMRLPIHVEATDRGSIVMWWPTGNGAYSGPEIAKEAYVEWRRRLMNEARQVA
jgi:hypothetical protein